MLGHILDMLREYEDTQGDSEQQNGTRLKALAWIHCASQGIQAQNRFRILARSIQLP